MAAVREAVCECPDLVAALAQHVVDPLVDHHGRNRSIRRRQLLGGSEDVRPDAERLRPPQVSGPTKAANHFVGNEQHLVPISDLLHLLEVACRGQQHSAGAHHGLGNHRRDSVRAFGQNLLI